MKRVLGSLVTHRLTLWCRHSHTARIHSSLFVCLFVWVCFSIYISIYCIYLPFYLYICLPACLPAYLSACLSTVWVTDYCIPCLFLCASVCLFLLAQRDLIYVYYIGQCRLNEYSLGFQYWQHTLKKWLRDRICYLAPDHLLLFYVMNCLICSSEAYVKPHFYQRQSSRAMTNSSKPLIFQVDTNPEDNIQYIIWLEWIN